MPVYPSLNLNVQIHRPIEVVRDFLAKPENFPRWAAGLGKDLKKENDQWAVDTDQGSLKIRFSPQNELGVADHWVTLPDGDEISIPLRAVQNGSGAEVILTLFRIKGMTPEQFREDEGKVISDLKALKTILESTAFGPVVGIEGP